ncbi:conserved hypothetical protein [Leishmania braziliensis MHOM/BR/75/M2904]|uniref:Uncharacterized protein n=2 Tax=Leishmania braziliensis TaxID=5660 RepID=A4HBE8_LEIBR|nr:conserved hypothetical protein [Leishmania braziliensis MHOM/BR/75/M2904]CAJ2471773.1 unnamed protein product [Leishmania braziliensis]CAM38734.2 conserved hypothetical protein [Leishmania braziliensis MHOM/BR/75/M2904]SYZ65430.1 hypothetical_protein [Leishmania braziliensis MHOM/BR/75/M2904]
MATKRCRSHVDVVGGIDELLTIPVCSPPHGEEPLDTKSSSRQPHSSPQVIDIDVISPTAVKRLRTSESSTGVSYHSPSTVSPSSPRTICDSIGGDEIDLLRRKDEEVADMALFLAKAVGETSSRHSLAELVAFLGRLGVSRVVLAVKRVGELSTLVGHLHQATLLTENERRIAIALFYTLMGHIDAEALFQECVVRFLVKSLCPAERQEALFAVHRRTAPHWSMRPKLNGAGQRSSPSTPGDVTDGLEGQVARLCGGTAEGTGVYEGRSCASLALRSLLTLMFLYNSWPHVTAQQHLSVPLLFANAGGLEQLGKLLICGDTQEHALALLEVLTATEELCSQNAGLLALVPLLVAQLHTCAVTVPVLKVLTNITNILPHALHATGTATTFAHFALQTFSHAQALCTPDETEIFVLCCAINVIKYESKEMECSKAELASTLVASRDTLVSLATAMMESHRCNNTEQLVRSGYYALLLGALSLVSATEEGSSTLRVPVMTAVAGVLGDTSIGLTIAHQPMRIVVAIIQEFLLFQSSAGTLTKETLKEMKALVDRILNSNQIDIAPEGDRSSSAAETTTAASPDEDDDLLLGQLL